MKGNEIPMRGRMHALQHANAIVTLYDSDRISHAKVRASHWLPMVDKNREQCQPPLRGVT